MLHIHRAERADGLVEGLRAVLAAPPADPFATEVVAVPTRGMERWLTQRMASVFGICANVDFPFPGRVIADAVATASGIDPDADPWRPERAVWALVDVVEEALGEPWLAALAGHLGHGDDPVRAARRLPVLRHLADLFDRYAIHRPDTLLLWGAGEGDGWQPELWRRLRARIGLAGPAERLAAGCSRLREDRAVVELPGRLSMFGFTR